MQSNATGFGCGPWLRLVFGVVVVVVVVFVCFNKREPERKGRGRGVELHIIVSMHCRCEEQRADDDVRGLGGAHSGRRIHRGMSPQFATPTTDVRVHDRRVLGGCGLAICWRSRPEPNFAAHTSFPYLLPLPGWRTNYPARCSEQLHALPVTTCQILDSSTLGSYRLQMAMQRRRRSTSPMFHVH